MAKLNLTSSTTFLYFNDLEGAKRFFAETLGLPTALDQRSEERRVGKEC